jgi:hypothetical protein
LLTPEFLTETWGMMNRRAASGIDGESTEQFESELKQRVLYERGSNRHAHPLDPPG